MAPVSGRPTVESDGDYVHVRYDDPGAYETVCTPEWAEKAAGSVREGCELRVGRPADGDGWEPLAVCVPEPTEPADALRIADEVLQRVDY